MSKPKLLNSKDPDPVEAEYIPKEAKDLNLDRTDKYVQALIKRKDAAETLELLTKQVTVKNLLINERILKCLEELEGVTSMKERMIIVGEIQILTAAAKSITENKIALDKALGLPLAASLPEGSPTSPRPQPREMTPEEFEQVCVEEAIKAGQPPPTSAGQA